MSARETHARQLLKEARKEIARLRLLLQQYAKDNERLNEANLELNDSVERFFKESRRDIARHKAS